MEPLIKHRCFQCGVTGESNLHISGKHIKQTCGACERYVKFYPQANLPTIKELKLRIWELCGKDLTKVKESAAGLCVGLETFIDLWKVYFWLYQLDKF
jgi:hypothetical protein